MSQHCSSISGSDATGTTRSSSPSAPQAYEVGNGDFKIPAPPIANRGIESHKAMKSPPTDVSGKTRQQNRTSQAAFRERNKMTIKGLHEELNQALETNEELCKVLRGLLEKTEDLRKYVEDVLASRSRRSNRESLALLDRLRI